MLMALPSFAVERSCEPRHLATSCQTSLCIPCSEPNFEISTVDRFTTRSVTVALVLVVALSPEIASPDAIETRHGFFCEHSFVSSFVVLECAGYDDVCLL